MTNQERAEKIVREGNEKKWSNGELRDAITSQLDEAIKEATELDFSKWPDLESRLEGIAESANRGQSKHAVKVVLRTLVDQAVRDAYGQGAEDASVVTGLDTIREHEFQLGFASAREKAAHYCETHALTCESAAEAIRAMEADKETRR